MYKTKRIHYKVIFKQDGQSETIEYKSIGSVNTDGDTHIRFETESGLIEFIYNEENITLKNGQSVLRFSFHKDIWNEYQLPYGSVPLKTKLIKFIADEECIKMKYELLDQESVISTAYILMTLLPHHDLEEL